MVFILAGGVKKTNGENGDASQTASVINVCSIRSCAGVKAVNGLG
jgi:hypothetical protein